MPNVADFKQLIKKNSYIAKYFFISYNPHKKAGEEFMKKIISTTLFGVIFMLPQTVLGGTCTAAVCSQDVANIVTPEILSN